MNTVSDSMILYSNSREICRMAWFLVETTNSRSDFKRSFCIIHSVDLIDGDFGNIYINRVINFKRNQNILQGRLVLASDSRDIVEGHLRSLKTDTETVPIVAGTYYLVQYHKSVNNICFAVVNQRQISWSIEEGRKEVFIKDGKILRTGTVLFSHESETLLEWELEKLNNSLFDQVVEENLNDTDLSEKPWFLVRYRCSNSNTIYAVVGLNETIWHKENLFKGVVAYLSENQSVYQALILHKAHTRSIVENCLLNIKDTSLSLNFPSSH